MAHVVHMVEGIKAGTLVELMGVVIKAVSMVGLMLVGLKKIRWH